VRGTISVLIAAHYFFNVAYQKLQLEVEGARDSAYLRQVNFYRRPVFKKKLRGHVRNVSGNMHIKFEVRSFIRFGAIGI